MQNEQRDEGQVVVHTVVGTFPVRESYTVRAVAVRFRALGNTETGSQL